jgi:hypothetical protein
MKHEHSLDYVCLGVGHASVSDTDTYDNTELRLFLKIIIGVGVSVSVSVLHRKSPLFCATLFTTKCCLITATTTLQHCGIAKFEIFAICN